MKAITVTLMLDVPDEYTNDDYSAIAKEMARAVNNWPTNETVIDWEWSHDGDT
jgi:hypothetical protein